MTEPRSRTAAKKTAAEPAAPERPKSLAAALARLQADLPRVVKDKTARVVSKRTGGQYEYKYADLSTVSDALMPKLGELGLSFSTKPTMTEDQGFVLHYILRHSPSGDWDEGLYPLPNPATTDAQQVGSAITYARRYALCAVTGLAADIEDDGALATIGQREARSARQQAEDQGYDPYDSGPALGNGTTKPRDWIKEAQALFDAGELQQLLELGRECFDAGELVGETKDKLLSLRDQARARQAESQEKEKTG